MSKTIKLNNVELYYGFSTKFNYVALFKLLLQNIILFNFINSI